MYKILCDDFTLYNPLSNELVLTDPVLNGELSKAGSLSFTINPMHPYYSKINKMQSIISVFQDNEVIFKGRVFSDNVNFYKMKKVEVEGLLAYFNDSVVRPYDFNGSVEAYVAFLINQHNEQVTESQRFKLGIVTVTDPNDYIVRSSTQLPNTWNEIEEKLIKLLGGYLRVRYTDNGNFIDYLEEMPNTAVQDIQFAVNLLDLENTVSAENIATCIIPYGAKIEESNGGENDEVNEDSEKRVDITSVNNGIDYIFNADAVSKYGKIFEVVYFDDVTIPENLLKKAKTYLLNKVLLNGKLTIKAIDLHLADADIQAFRLGDKIQVYSEPHGIKDTMLLYSYSLNLTDPSSFVFSVNKEKNSLLDSQISVERQSSENVKRIDQVVNNVNITNTKLNAIIQEMESNYTALLQNSQEIVLQAMQDYVKTGDYETFRQTITTELETRADGITMKFNEIADNLTNESGEINRQLTELSRYIRFSASGIELGEKNQPTTTNIENGKFSIKENGEDVAYVEKYKMHIKDLEVESKLTIGNFAFVPRSNGNLSFMKVK